MKSDVIQIYSDLRGKEEAIASAEKFIRYHRLDGKNAMHIRLLTEELVSMVHGIMDDFMGNLWFESENAEDGLHCRICLSTKKSANEQQDKQLLSVSTSRKNENAKGILGKIRESFRISAQNAADGMYINEFSAMNNWFEMGAHRCEITDTGLEEAYWSLRSYRNQLEPDRTKAKEEWDELEKSIIAKVADDVKVWLKSDTTELVVDKLIRNV